MRVERGLGDVRVTANSMRSVLAPAFTLPVTSMS